ncbi:MAG TPA: DUF72 domain-containing protein [Opitutaceae bacterium]|nr:DUF72 domain-containing protein [Opitutaceae bacterium]
MPDLRIGISGWTYAPWRGTFFPRGLRQREELAHASRQVASIEINGTFYSLQRASSYRAWAAAVPDDFVFAVKGPRFITHIRRLRDVRTPLANFFASGVLLLGEKLGPLLWQLPPSLPFDPARLAAFFELLPRDTHAAAELARDHDHRVPAFRAEDAPRRPLRHALEVRHPSFVTPEFVALLRRHRIALVVADTAGKWPFLEDVTADFVYARLHGDAELYVSGYTDAALREWARKIRAWARGGDPRGARRIGPPAARRARGRDVFVYFDNDVKVRAPFDAMMLAHFLGRGPRPPAAPPVASIPEVARTVWPAWRRRATTPPRPARGRVGKAEARVPGPARNRPGASRGRRAPPVQRRRPRPGASRSIARR